MKYSHLPLRQSPSRDSYDAVVVGSGPNGLAAAITVAQAGKSVLVMEAEEIPGGGARSMELTLPGFVHDVCSAVHPLGIASPFFRTLPLEKYGLEWIHAPSPLAHCFDEDDAVIVEHNFDSMCESMGEDGTAYRRLLAPFLPHLDVIFDETLGPLRFPRHPLLLSRLGLRLLQSADHMRHRFCTKKTQGLFAGLAAHSVLTFEKPFSAGVAVMLALTMHDKGWPIPKGGSQSLTNALIAYLQSLGGEVIVKNRVKTIKDIPHATSILFDTSPRSLVEIMREKLPTGYKKSLSAFRYGPSIFKLDWALDGPIPWTDERCLHSATVHLGGTHEEIASSERDAWNGNISDQPFVILAQPSLFDSSRAPKGKHTSWAYCHVPHGSHADMTDAIENQIERFAPGFKKLILKRHVMNPKEIEKHNANYIDGDITGGVMDLRQLFTRPLAKIDPYATPVKGIFLCSSSTPPGSGVHGMCGYHAARSALRSSARG